MKSSNEQASVNDKPMLTGDDAIIAAGFPVDFMAAVHKVADLTGAAISFRAGQPPNTDKGYDVAFKPMAVKTKTFGSNQGVPMLAGFIPMDQQRFGRSGSAPLPAEDFGSSQLKVSLQELLNDTEKGLYDMTLSGDHLEFRPKANQIDRDACANPAAIEKSVFRINLVDAAKRSQPQVLSPRTTAQVNLSNKPFEEVKQPNKPGFWNDRFGDFDSLLTTHYLVEDKMQGEHDFNKTILLGKTPLTGDADGFSFAPPIDYAQDNNTAFEKQYNVSNPMQIGKFLAQFLLVLELYQPGASQDLGLHDIAASVNDFNALFKNAAKQIKITGLATPFEACVAYLINREIKNSPRAKTTMTGQLAQIILHGPETNNPGKPSSLDGDIIHVFPRAQDQQINRVVLTRSEHQLVNLVKEEYVAKFVMRIHPKWDEVKWADVQKLVGTEKIGPGTSEVIRKKFGATQSSQAKRPGLPHTWTRQGAEPAQSPAPQHQVAEPQRRARTNSVVERFRREIAEANSSVSSAKSDNPESSKGTRSSYK